MVVHAAGIVTAVDGTAKPTACGVAGAPGSFAVANPRSTASTTVDVTAATRFFGPRGPKGPGGPIDTFAGVCVGESVLARGVAVSGAFSATAVFVYPRRPTIHAAGIVTAVDGTAKATACGVAGAPGSFAVANPRSTASTTVDVTATTRFFGPRGPRRPIGPIDTFAGVCVGESVLARGVAVSGAFSATAVFVFPRAKVDPGDSGRPTRLLASTSLH